MDKFTSLNEGVLSENWMEWIQKQEETLIKKKEEEDKVKEEILIVTKFYIYIYIFDNN